MLILKPTYISDTFQLDNSRHFIVSGTIFYISRHIHSWFTARQECQFRGKHIVIFDIFHFFLLGLNDIITDMVIIFFLIILLYIGVQRIQAHMHCLQCTHTYAQLHITRRTYVRMLPECCQRPNCNTLDLDHIGR